MKKALLSALALFAGTAVFAQNPVDLILSEVVEGSGNNKGFEIFNPTDAAINLGDYEIKRYNNGALTPSGGTLALDNVMLQPGEVWVCINGQTVAQPNSPACDPALQALADQLGGAYPDPCYNNGNDAVTIEKNDVIIDLFGKIGEDPGVAWTDSTGRWWTANHTLIRKCNVGVGITANPNEFDVTAQWDSLPQDTWDSLGTHYFCQTIGIFDVPQQRYDHVFLFPNPSADGNFTVKATDWVQHVRVYDINGRMIFNRENNTNVGSITVDLGREAHGLHIVAIELSNGTVITRKLSVQ